jgi:DNA-binding PadR family transcriptional regulator
MNRDADILPSLYQPKHGYAVMQIIEDKTNGRLLLGAGTLYRTADF